MIHTHSSVDTLSRMDVELFVQSARSRRMVAAIEYEAGQNLKLEKAASKLSDRLKREYDMLQKEILKLDNAIEKTDLRLIRIDNLKNELGLIQDVINLDETES